MPTEPSIKQLERNPVEGWRSLLLLSIYRWALALFLAAIFYTGHGSDFIGDGLQTQLFGEACLFYLVLCLPTTVAVIARWPALNWQIYLHAVLDVVVLTLLVYAGDGVQSGLGLLLIAPLAGYSILLSRRIAILFGAIATLGLLGEEAYRQLQLVAEPAHFIQAGMLGLIYFLAVLVANTLSLRARTSEALAATSKTALASLSQINERIIQNMQMGVLVIDAQQNIRLLNQASCQFLNIRPGAVGKDLISESAELAEALDSWLQKPLRDSDPLSLETADRNLMVHFSRLDSTGDAPTLVFLEDASRVGEQAQQIKLASLGRLSASIAHEIRNPLGAISHASQLLMENSSSQPQDRKLLDIILRHTGRINTIIEDILRLSRRGNAAPETLRLRPWIEQLIREYKESHPQGSPAFEYDHISPVAEIRADPNHLRQILNNLWDNAAEHSGLPRERLQIKLVGDVWPESGRVHLDIANNGRSISAEVAAQIFEPFFTTAHKGTGLGLYIVRELCECNHAKLSCMPGEESGARFRIIFANPADWMAQEGISSTPDKLAAQS